MAYLGEFAAAVAEVEGVEPDTFDFYGVRLRARTRIGLMPLMKFAYVSTQGAEVESLEGAAAIYGMIRDCVDPDDFATFEQLCIDNSTDTDTLFELVKVLIEAASARPTRKPSDSSDGLSPISVNSTGRSPSPEANGFVTVGSALADYSG